jgi:CheY-like chemotaxis protein
LIGALAWPVFCLILLGVLFTPIRSFVGTLERFSLKTAGIQLEAEIAKDRVASALTEASRIKQSREGTAGSNGTGSSVERVVHKVVSPGAMRGLAGALILWVDDHPNNNVLERRALEALGVRFTNVTSNETARDVLKYSPSYNAIISDLSRDGDGCSNLTKPEECGKCKAFELLHWMTKAGTAHPPIIFYTSQDKALVCKSYAIEKGAFGLTGEPAQLLELVSRSTPP